MASEELTEEGESANAGLLDSRMAYDWVREHIAELGGDPENLTIMGQVSFYDPSILHLLIACSSLEEALLLLLN